MNRLVLIIGGIILLLLVGGGVFLASNKSSQISQNPVSVSGSPRSLKDLLGLGGSQQCSFSDASGNSQIIYVSNGKVRGDFMSGTGQSVMKSHMIVDGQTSYLWVDGQNTGFKMTLDAATQAQG